MRERVNLLKICSKVLSVKVGVNGFYNKGLYPTPVLSNIIFNSFCILFIQCELSISTRTFLNNYDITNRKLYLSVTDSTVWKRNESIKCNIVENTLNQSESFGNVLLCNLNWISKNITDLKFVILKFLKFKYYPPPRAPLGFAV